MGLFSKIAFWRHEEALPSTGSIGAFDRGFGASDLGLPKDSFNMPVLEPSASSNPSFGASSAGMANPFQSMSQQSFSPQNSEMQMVSAKLDTIKVLIENIGARLARLEQMAQQENQPEPVIPQRSQPTVRWG